MAKTVSKLTAHKMNIRPINLMKGSTFKKILPTTRRKNPSKEKGITKKKKLDLITFLRLKGADIRCTIPGFSIGKEVKVNLEFNPAIIKASIPRLIKAIKFLTEGCGIGIVFILIIKTIIIAKIISS